MKTLNLVTLCLLTVCALTSCKRGFNLEESTTIEEEDADRIFIGANEEASWKLLIDDENDNFTLENKSSPSSSTNNYSVNGNFSTTSSGWLELDISSTRDDEIEADIIYGIEIGDHAIVLEPFTNVDDEWVPLIAVDDGCPSSNQSGLAIMLNRPSDASADDVIWVSEYTYDDDDEDFDFDNGISLDADYQKHDALIQDSDNCSDGYVTRSAGDHYIGDTATLVEVDDDVITDGYTRAFGLPGRSLDDVGDVDSQEYVGLIRDYSQAAGFYDRVTATCVNGICDIIESNTSILQLSLLESGLNYENIDGIVTATIQDPASTYNDTRAVCIANSDIGSDSDTQKLLLCSGQALSDNEMPLQIILSAID